jgi:hypothetical protein
MKTSTMRRVAPPVLAVVASLAFALPAPAGVRPDDRPGLHGTGAATGSTQMRPDDRSGVRVGLLDDSRLPLAQLTRPSPATSKRTTNAPAAKTT